NRVSIVDLRRGFAGGRYDPGGRQELILDPRPIAVIHECEWVGGTWPDALHHRSVGALRAVPPPVAVHGVIPSADLGDLLHPNLPYLPLQLLDETGCAG